MPSRATAPLLLAALAVLAGCGGFAGTGAESTPPETATPAPVPTVSPTPVEVREVSGLSARGVTGPFDLAAAHYGTLSNRSYTRETTTEERFANRSLRRREAATVRVVPTGDGTRYLSRTTFEGPVEPVGTVFPDAARVDTYGADRAYVRVTYPNGTREYDAFDRIGGRSETLPLVLASFETRLAGRTPCGDRSCYVVRSTALANGDYLRQALVPFDNRMVTDASLVAFVDGRGLVREYRVQYTVEAPAREYTAVRRVRYSRLGDTVVERPAWVANVTATARPTG